MRISLNWLKRYVDISVPNDELIRLIGARLVEVEDVIDETHKYDNIYVAKVVECEKIEGTHLSLCKIETKNGLVQVVCGAPNVHAGMLAAWIAPGAIVPASVHDAEPFVIGTRKMLGKYESNGMLAGADELDFGDDHSGIVEIDPAIAKPGDKLADIFELNDIILDIENKSLTHRPDCFGLIGFAREVAGILGQKFEFCNDELSLAHFAGCCRELAPEPREDGREECGDKDNLIIAISDATLCPRYSALVLDKTAPIAHPYLTWQDTILSKSGMRPVEPIVDATNYFMLLTGQPLHAFDYDKFIAAGKSNEPKIIVRAARAGEKLTLLDDKEIELNETDIVITSNDVPVALAGAMGGKSTTIDQNTKKIILESATFSLYNLRKTQMSHGIFSEAITRFTKGQPAYQTLAVAGACADALKTSFAISAVADSYPRPVQPSVVKITTDEINNLLGTTYSQELIVSTLKNVNFQIASSVTGELEVTAPLWRTDIHIKEDIIEEIGRILGYDNITPTLPLHATAEKNPLFVLKQKIRQILTSKNAHELLTYTFVSEKLLQNAGENPADSYKIVNSLSPELQYVRQSLIPSLLDKAYLNVKIPHDNFAIYEMNQVYHKSAGLDADGVPIPQNKIALVVADRKRTDAAYYTAKLYAETLLRSLGIAFDFTLLINDATLEPKRAAKIILPGQPAIQLGVIGELKRSARHDFKLPDFVAAFELDLDAILAATQKHRATIANVLDYASRDLTIASTANYAAIYGQIAAALTARQLIFKISPTSIYQPTETNVKNFSFHLEFASPNESLTPATIADIMTELEKIA